MCTVMLCRQYCIVALSFLLCSISLSCREKKDPATAVPPVFSVTPVRMDGPFDEGNLLKGDIKFLPPVLVPFGESLGGGRFSPAIEYYTRPDAPVRAVTAGLIDTIFANPAEQGDYELHIVCLPGSDYLIIYDHLLEIAVLQGSLVEPGDTLGKAGTWNDQMRRVELQINTGTGANTRSYCPLNFGDTAYVRLHHELLQEYNIRGFVPQYDTLCLTGVVTP